jgi:cell division protein FtsB
VNGKHLLCLQAKFMRLNGSASAVAAAGELLEQLKKENAALSSDNERLLSYVEGLESAATGALNSGRPKSESGKAGV